jgi:putative MATE family efflux protein
MARNLSERAMDVGVAADAGAVPERTRIQGIWEIAWPTITGNLLMSITGIVDLKIVGALGAPSIAAVGAGMRLFFVSQAILIGINAGTTALVARAWGAGDRAEAARSAHTALLLSAIAATGMALPGLLVPEALLALFSIDPVATALAAEYVRTLSAFNVCFGVVMALTSALRAAGDTRTPLWIGALANVINVVCDYGLVYGKLGMPRLGVSGAALATGLSFTAGAAILVSLWWRGRLAIPRASAPALSPARTTSMIRIGYPAALEQVVWQGGFVAFLAIVSLYGTAPFAAYNIGVQLLSFSFVIGFGFSIASSTLVGQHLGAGDPDMARRSGWRALRISIAVMSVFGLAIIVSAETLARAIVSDPEVVKHTVLFIHVLGAAQPLMAIDFPLGGALRGAGDTRFPMWSTFFGLICIRVGIASVMAAHGWSIEWVYGVLIADYVCKASLLTLRFRSRAWERAMA